MRRRSRLALAAIVALALAPSLAACGGSGAPDAAGTAAVVRVPADASLAEAGSRVADGGVILIAPGTYHESLEVRGDDVTVRGEDRNGVILDGELKRSNGVVATGARVAVENLTVQNFLQNGVLVTGVTDESGAGVARGPDGYIPGDIPDPVPGYLVQRVTAANNGLYGIYAFNRTGGEIRDNLASGGSDSGIYVGQCASCNAVVADNVVQWNAVGIELANASDVTVTGNRIVENRIGVSVLSNYLEAHGPTSGLVVAGNLIADNNAAETPEQAGGAFGVGIGLGGTVGATVRANRITGNQNVGAWVTSSEDFAPKDTTVEANAWGGNGADAVFSPNPDYAGSGNCFRLQDAAVAVPPTLLQDGCGAIQPAAYEQPAAPNGIPFSKVAFPPQRPGLPKADDRPRTVPDTVTTPSTADLAVPEADLLEQPK